MLTTLFSFFAFVRWYDFSFFVGSLFFIHWLGLLATIFIVVLVPIYYILKRKRPRKIKTLLRIHVFGNLFAFLLVSVHFAQNTGRLIQFPRLEDGFVLFLVLSIIIITGMFERFGNKLKLVRYTDLIHRYAVVILYLVTFIHVLQGFILI
jgi:hypothetical protein